MLLRFFNLKFGIELIETLILIALIKITRPYHLAAVRPCCIHTIA